MRERTIVVQTSSGQMAHCWHFSWLSFKLTYLPISTKWSTSYTFNLFLHNYAVVIGLVSFILGFDFNGVLFTFGLGILKILQLILIVLIVLREFTKLVLSFSFIVIPLILN